MHELAYMHADTCTHTCLHTDAHVWNLHIHVYTDMQICMHAYTHIERKSMFQVNTVVERPSHTENSRSHLTSSSTSRASSSKSRAANMWHQEQVSRNSECYYFPSGGTQLGLQCPDPHMEMIFSRHEHCLGQHRPTFPAETQLVKILGFGQVVSASSRRCLCCGVNQTQSINA